MATATTPELEVESPIVEPSDHYEVVDGRIVAEHYEVVDGRVVEEPPLGALEVWIAARLVRAIILFDGPGLLGTVVEEMLFVLEHTPRLRRRPDVAFVSNERWPVTRPAPSVAAWNVVPDIAIEITSPTDLIDDLMDKLEEYFAAGVRHVWVVYPKHLKVYDYDTPSSVRVLQVGDELDGGAVLPGFVLPLSRLFETQEDGPAPEA